MISFVALVIVAGTGLAVGYAFAAWWFQDV